MTPETDAAPCPGMNRETGQPPWRAVPSNEDGQGDACDGDCLGTCAGGAGAGKSRIGERSLFAIE